ncbi:MAG: DUF177 domain-containing protein [Lactobacillus sp.]|jgi:uncharacterized protein|nr:DUF177 domain-containing protein [Lactobacillus sp.]
MLQYSFEQLHDQPGVLKAVDEDVTVTAEFKERSRNLINDAKNIHVQGQFFADGDYVTGNFHVTAEVEAPSTRSLAPVDLEQDFDFTETYCDHKPTAEELEDNPGLIQIADGEIDLQTAVEDNLLLSLPTTILTPAEKNDDLFPHGQGWEVVSEQKAAQARTDKPNPAFAKLKGLFPPDKDN